MRPAPEESSKPNHCGRATDLIVAHGFRRANAGLKACATTSRVLPEASRPGGQGPPNGTRDPSGPYDKYVDGASGLCRRMLSVVKLGMWRTTVMRVVRVSRLIAGAEDVAPILYENCVTCHRVGEMAPMSLVTYEETRPWGRSIKNKVLSGEMPPWHADPSVGVFRNERRLTDARATSMGLSLAASSPRPLGLASRCFCSSSTPSPASRSTSLVSYRSRWDWR